MDSNFELFYTEYFMKQWTEFNDKSKEFIKDKLRIVKENPYRYPVHKGYTRVRKIKLSMEGKYQRLMYALHMPESNNILILGVFARKCNYKDFENIFKNLKS